MHAASWYLLTERADEIEVRVNGSKKTFESCTRAEFVYKLSAAADADDYKRNLRYDEDLYGTAGLSGCLLGCKG